MANVRKDKGEEEDMRNKSERIDKREKQIVLREELVILSPKKKKKPYEYTFLRGFYVYFCVSCSNLSLWIVVNP